jgi:hypothetical protein
MFATRGRPIIPYLPAVYFFSISVKDFIVNLVSQLIVFIQSAREDLGFKE